MRKYVIKMTFGYNEYRAYDDGRLETWSNFDMKWHRSKVFTDEQALIQNGAVQVDKFEWEGGNYE